MTAAGISIAMYYSSIIKAEVISEWESWREWERWRAPCGVFVNILHLKINSCHFLPFVICYLLSNCCYLTCSECIIGLFVVIIVTARPQLADRATANALVFDTLLFRNNNNKLSMCQKEIAYFPTD